MSKGIKEEEKGGERPDGIRGGIPGEGGEDGGKAEKKAKEEDASLDGIPPRVPMGWVHSPTTSVPKSISDEGGSSTKAYKGSGTPGFLVHEVEEADENNDGGKVLKDNA